MTTIAEETFVCEECGYFREEPDDLCFCTDDWGFICEECRHHRSDLRDPCLCDVGECDPDCTCGKERWDKVWVYPIASKGFRKYLLPVNSDDLSHNNPWLAKAFWPLEI